MHPAPDLCSSHQFWSNQWSPILLRPWLCTLLVRSSWPLLFDHRRDLLLLCWDQLDLNDYQPSSPPDTGGLPWLLHAVTHRLCLLYHYQTGACSNPCVEIDSSSGRSSIFLGSLIKISHSHFSHKSQMLKLQPVSPPLSSPSNVLNSLEAMVPHCETSLQTNNARPISGYCC